MQFHISSWGSDHTASFLQCDLHGNEYGRSSSLDFAENLNCFIWNSILDDLNLVKVASVHSFWWYCFSKAQSLSPLATCWTPHLEQMTLSCFAVARNSILPRFEKFVRRCDANRLSANLPTNREARELWKVYRVAKHEAGRTVYYIKVHNQIKVVMASWM